MAGSFTPRQLFLVKRLQGRGVALHLEESLIQSYHPLRAAMTAYLTMGELGALTFVVSDMADDGRVEGFVQIRERRVYPEADVLFIAPTLTTDVDARAWADLLTCACQQVGQHGIERLFARLPEGGEEVLLFQQMGFSIYTREDIFVLNTDKLTGIEPSTDTAVRPCCSADMIGLHQLYAAVAPRLVQQAENVTARNRLCPLEVWPSGSNRQGWVLERNGEVVGCLTVRLGRVGHWLYMLLHPQAYEHAGALLTHGLVALRDAPSSQIYGSVREYQGGLRAVLEDAGFHLFGHQALAVKHTTVRVTDPVRKLISALEKRAEVTTPTVSPVNGQPASRHIEPVN